MMARAINTGNKCGTPAVLQNRYPSRHYPAPQGYRPKAIGSHTLKTVAFTGHRPEKLPWGNNENTPEAALFKFRLREALEYLIGRGYVNFLSGAARGFDTIAAEIVISLREVYPWIKLTVVLPCADQAARWNADDRARWENIVHNSDHVETLAQAYDKGCMFRRNRYLVDNADLVLAACQKGNTGGTAMTVDYARKKGVKVRRLSFDGSKGPKAQNGGTV